MTRISRSVSIITFAAVVLVLVGTIQITKAAPIAYEGFDYDVGKNLNGLSGGSGFEGSWIVDQYTYVIAAGSLSNSTNSLPSSGNALRHEGSQPRARRNLRKPVGDTGTTIYCSFLLREDSSGKGTDHDWGGLILGGSNTALACGIGGLYIGADGPTNHANRFVIGSAGDAKPERGSRSPVVIGKVTLLVVRLDFLDGPDKATLYVNPTPGDPEPTNGTVYSGIDLGQFSQLAITQGNNSSWTTDEIRIATTWDEVTPSVRSSFATANLQADGHPGRTFFSDDFSSGNTANWKQYDGKFSIVNGAYQLQSTAFLNDARTVAGNTSWTDYSIDLDYNIIDQGHTDPPTGPSDWPANVLFRVADVSSGLNQGHYYQFIIGPTRYEINYVYGSADKVENLGTATFSGFPVHSWHHLKLNVVGETASAFVDGKNVLTTSLVSQDERDPRGPSAGAIGLKADDGSTVQFDNIRVSSVPEVTPKAQSKFVTVSLRSVANSQHHQEATGFAGFPISETGIKTLGGVPFDLLSPSGKNAWDSQFGTVPGVRSTKTLILPVNVFGASNVYTLINTSWGVEGSTTVSLSFVCSDGMHHTVTFKSGDDIRDWNSLSYVKAINERSTQNMTPDLTDRRIDRQQIVLPKAFAERTLTKIVLTDSGVTGKDDDNFNRRVLAQRAFLLGLTVETANGNPNQSPLVFDALTQKLLDETISKLKGKRAKQVSELKQKFKQHADVLAAERTELGDDMQRAVLKVIALPDGKPAEVSQVELDTLKAINDAIERAGKESDSTLAMPQCKNEVLAVVDKNNVWDEETRTRQFEIIYSAPAEKRKRLVAVYSKYEPKFVVLSQRESAQAEQYKKDLLEIISPDTGNEK